MGSAVVLASPGVEFRILGRLEVVEHGQALELGGPQQRVLLVALLLDANMVVSADRLIEVVWEGAPPPTAQKALQVHISQLRKLLGRERLETQAPGYVLRIEPGELDFDSFERLWREGQLAEALSLWRGPPLAEFAYHELGRREIGRLEERRLRCLEERIDSDLAVGKHEALVAELETLVREEPLREGLRSRLMLALYRADRQAEALQTYQEGRDVLVEELGIEPSRTLRGLQRQILAQDPGLDAPVAAAPRPERATVAVPVVSEVAVDVLKTVTALAARIAVVGRDGASVDPEARRHVIVRALAEVERAVSLHGGTVETSTGDALTAVFGLPVVHEDDGLRGVRSAAELSARLTALATELEADARPGIEYGVGISTGRVVAGGMTPHATGEPLSISLRLSEAAAAGEVLVDEATWRRVRYEVTCESAGDVWRLVDPECAQSSRRLISPMVGRERERRRLQDAFEQALGDRSCQLFTVLGLAGVGKSRLVQEFLGDLDESVVVARGRCLPYGEGITYWPLLEAVKEAVGLHDFDSREAGREKIRQAFDQDGAAAMAERVAGLVGLAETESRVEEAFAAVRSLFESLAMKQPLVVVFDDIHWGEATFLDLVEDLADWSRDAPILLVCLARRELLDLRPNWGGGKLNSTTSLLEPLDADDCSRLIENLLGDDELPEAVTTQIVEAAEGNPLFVEEMLLMLVEDEQLVRRAGRWSLASGFEAISVPPTIEALLATRLDQLDGVERAVIERAAIIGKVFYEDAVVALMPETAGSATDLALRSLVRKELIRPERPSLGGQCHRFRHLLILDAAYDAVSKQTRADVHQRFGEWLERAAGDRMIEYEEVVGYHFERAFQCRVELAPADDAARALAHEAGKRLGSAGRRAFALSDPTTGLKLVSRAVSLLAPDDPLRVELVPNVRAVQARNRDLVWADRVLTEAVEAAATSGNRLLAARALVQRGLLRLFTEARVTAEELLESADRSIAVFESFDDELGLARAWRLKAQAHYLARSGGACAGASERALDHARRAHDRFEEREIIEWLVIALLLGPTQVDHALERCETLLTETVDGSLRAQILGSMAALVTMLRGPADAEELADRSRTILAGVGSEIWIVAFWRSFVHMARHDPVAAEHELRPSYDGLKRRGERSHFSTITHALGTALYLQGRLDEAEAMTRECEDACQPNDVHSAILWRSTRAKILAATGSIDDAERLGREAVALAATSDFLLARAQSSLDLAEVLTLAGKKASAASSTEEADRLFALKGVRPEVGRAWAG